MIIIGLLHLLCYAGKVTSSTISGVLLLAVLGVAAITVIVTIVAYHYKRGNRDEEGKITHSHNYFKIRIDIHA